MKTEDALYHAVHDYPAGVDALAVRMGLSPKTVQSMADPNQPDHGWPLKRFRQVMTFTGDLRPLESLCAEFGGVFVPLGNFNALPDERVLKAAQKLSKEFGESTVKLATVLADGRITPRELSEYRRELQEVQQACASLMKLAERICTEHLTVPEDHRP